MEVGFGSPPLFNYMACFDNIISYKGGCASVSGLLLDNLITTKEIESYIDADYGSASEFIDEKISFAVTNVVNEANNHFQKYYIPRTILDDRRAGFFDQDKVLVAAEAKYKGLELELCEQDTYYELYVSAIETYFNYTGDVDVLIIDTMTGQTLDTITVSSVAGEIVTTYVGKSYKSDKRKRRIGFVYDATSIPNYKTSLIGEGCHACNQNKYTLSGIVNGRNIEYDLADAPILTNITSGSDTAGLSVRFNVSCDNESWICNYRNLLALPILYRTAELIMDYALFNSDRLNSQSVKKNNIDARQMKYHEDYLAALETVLKNMIPPTDGMCFECKRNAKYVTTLP